jgi:hypothetical protein
VPNFVILERAIACKNTSKFDKINNAEMEYIYIYVCVCVCVCMCVYIYIYPAFQEQYTAVLLNKVPCVNLHRHNQRHLYARWNGYGDTGERNSKECKLLHVYGLPNTIRTRRNYRSCYVNACT